ncbi:hypothetical protein N7486_006266 [Penicillium sp. IBT 16267x]|nr:hypothetical protein N7486_006266 [Penicillium sp. IBT 16267x]
MSLDPGAEDHIADDYPISQDENRERAGSRVRFDLPTSNKNSKSFRRTANLYDSVAGRVNNNGFAALRATRYGDTQASGGRDLRPEEVLYRHKPNKLKKIGEDESCYFAHETLPADRPLPSSEILKAVHAYSADFYTQKLRDSGKHNFYSMDESALLAVGILMEELAKEQLGENGDMVLTEEMWSSENEGADDDGNGSQIPQKRSRAETIEDAPILNEDMRGAVEKGEGHILPQAENEAIREEAHRSDSPQKKQKRKGPA